MPTLNADVPTFDCWVRREYLFDLQEHRGELERVTVFGVSALKGRALGWWCLVHSTGAVIGRLPISAFVHREDAPSLPLDWLQLWDAMSWDLSVHEFSHLGGRRCQAILKDHQRYEGRYEFTVDYFGSSYADNPGESGWKCAHLIALDNGCYALQPNNRLLWASPDVVTEPFPEELPRYRTNTQVWQVEQDSKWATEDSDRAYFRVKAP